MAKPKYPYLTVDTAAGKKATIFLDKVAYLSSAHDGGNVDVYLTGVPAPLQVRAAVGKQIIELIDQHVVAEWPPADMRMDADMQRRIAEEASRMAPGGGPVP